MDSNPDTFKKKLEYIIRETSNKEGGIPIDTFPKHINGIIKKLCVTPSSKKSKSIKSFIKIIRTRILGYLLSKYGLVKLKEIYSRIGLKEMQEVQTYSSKRYNLFKTMFLKSETE